MASTVEALIRKAITPAITKVADFNRKRLPEPEAHVFLAGINAPVDSEVTESDLEVTGDIPAELNGRYIRIGPNPLEPPHTASHHWFLGDGMVHGVALGDGTALWYRNRWIRSNAVSEALGEPPAPGKRHPRSDTVNTNVLGHAGSSWAVVEAGGYPVRIDDELNTIAHDPFGGTLQHGFSAHPHRDPDSGEMHAICYDAQTHDKIRHVVVTADGKVRREEPIAVQDGPMIHDCMITENYVIILDLPVTFSIKLMIAGQGFPYAWNDDHPARVGLLPKEGSNDDVIWCDVDPCFVFHPCNAFENENGTITMDVCAHDRMFTGSTQGPDSKATPFERWTIDPESRKVARRIIDADPQEFPRPNEERMGRAYRYAYTVALPDGFDNPNMMASKIYKHDLDTERRQVHDFGADNIPSEFVFVPRRGSKAEDDGWLMGYVTNPVEGSSQLVILNAQDFEAEPVARIHIPHRIPSGFHGNWIAD